MSEQEEKDQEIGADGWRDRMLFVSTELLKTPVRDLTAEELPLFRKAAMALAEMFVTLDEKLVTGYVPPRAWLRDVPEPGKLPSSDLHRNLQAESEVIVQKLLMIIEKHVGTKNPQTAKNLMEGLGRLMGVLAMFTSESVRLACLNNLKPEPEPANTRLSLVHDADTKEEN